MNGVSSTPCWSRRRWSASPCCVTQVLDCHVDVGRSSPSSRARRRRRAVRDGQVGAGCPNQLFVKRLLYGVCVGGLTLLLAAFWVGPFLFNHDYMTDMKYGFKPDGGSESFWSMLFDQDAVPRRRHQHAGDRRAPRHAIARRHVYGIALGLTGLIAVAMVYLTRDSLPVIGLLWNPRVLPWVYLIRYLMMMVGAAEVAGVLVNWIRNRPAREVPGVGTRSLIAGAHRRHRAAHLRLRLPDAARRAARSATSTPGGRSAPSTAMPRRPQRRLAGVQLPRLRGQAAVPRVPRPRPDDGRPRRTPSTAAAGRCGRSTTATASATASTARRWR